MKKAIAAALALSMLLSGCASWGDGNYHSVTPYMNTGNSSQEPDQISNFGQLYKAMMEMVTRGRDSNVLIAVDYNQGSLTRDIELARHKIKNEEPLGNYAVRDISYEYGVNGEQFTVVINIDYHYERSQILRIQTVETMEQVKNAIHTALKRYSKELVLIVDRYRETDFLEIVNQYAMDNPNVVIERPTVSQGVYPNRGSRRLIELKFRYKTSPDVLRSMKAWVDTVFESAELYVKGDDSNFEKYEHLYVFLMERNPHIYGSTLTPAYSILRNGVGDAEAYATLYAAMCRQAGLECYVVEGTLDGRHWYWNIALDSEAYYHMDLLRCLDEGFFSVRGDFQMENYVWDYSAFPECRPVKPAPEPSSEAPSEDPEETGSESTGAGEPEATETVPPAPTEEVPESATETVPADR